jgi:hypothetical protein
MPPRFAYWTIIAGGLPTAFRATEQEELMPTFQRLREKHPDAEMKWFARGKLWESPEAARAQSDRTRGYVREPAAPREEGAPTAAAPSGPSRGKSWRPGGEHRDPRQKFKDAKKDRNIRHRAEKFTRKFGGDGDRPPRTKPHGDALPTTGDSRSASPDWKNRPPREENAQARPPREDWRDRPRTSGAKDRPTHAGAWKDRPAAGDWKNRPPRADDRKDRPAHAGAWKDRPAREGAWSDRPPRERPHGDPVARSGSGSSFRDRPKGPPFDKRGGYKSGPPAPRGDRPLATGDWRDRAPKPEWRDRAPRAASWSDRPPREKPHGDPMRDDRSRPAPRPPADREGGGRDRAAKPEWRDRPPRQDWKDRPPRPGAESRAPREGGWKSQPPRPDWKNRPPRDESRSDRPPREKPHGDPLGDNRSRPPGQRPYAPKRFDRNQGTDERKPPAPRPAPDREPRRDDNPRPSAPPRPHDPQELPPGPQERGRLVKKKRT